MGVNGKKNGPEFVFALQYFVCVCVCRWCSSILVWMWQSAYCCSREVQRECLQRKAAEPCCPGITLCNRTTMHHSCDQFRTGGVSEWARDKRRGGWAVGVVAWGFHNWRVAGLIPAEARDKTSIRERTRAPFEPATLLRNVWRRFGDRSDIFRLYSRECWLDSVSFFFFCCCCFNRFWLIDGIQKTWWTKSFHCTVN